MIAIDSSAFVAIIMDEPERDRFLDVCSVDVRLITSLVSVVET